MVRGSAWIWPMRIGLVACCSLLPWLSGAWFAVCVLLLLPVLRAFLDALEERWTARACVLGGCFSAAMLLPDWALPVILLWYAAMTVMSLLPLSPGRTMIRWHIVLALLTAMVLLALLTGQYEGRLMPGLAQTAVDLIDQHPNSASLLLTAYQMGLARLEGNAAVTPAYQIFQFIVIPAEVRQQLLYSLRASLETLLQAYLPRWLTGWMILMALLPALAAEFGLHARDRGSDLPPLDRWYIPRRWSFAVMVMLFMGFLPYLTGAGVLVTLSAMVSTLAYWVCVIQGASLLIRIMDSRGFGPLTRCAAVTLGTVMLPILLFFLSCYDQYSDPRHLRGVRGETK